MNVFGGEQRRAKELKFLMIVINFTHNQSYSIGQSLRPLSTRVKAEDLINFIHRVRDLRCLPKQKYLWGWLAEMCRPILWL